MLQAASRPDRPTGPITGATIADAVGALLPEGAIVADEAQTGGLWAAGATAGAPRHDWLTLTGGAIGMGMPLATGAAVACPDRPVINLEADGSAMYTLQSLWTQAREGLDVTTIIFSNRSYAILNLELSRVGVAEPGPKALSMLDLTGPDLDFVAARARAWACPRRVPPTARRSPRTSSARSPNPARTSSKPSSPPASELRGWTLSTPSTARGRRRSEQR